MTDYQPGPEIRAALDAAATSGLILSWHPVPGRGPVVIAGDMGEWVLRSAREAGLFCGALSGAACAIADGKAAPSATIDMHRWYAIVTDGSTVLGVIGVQGRDGLGLYESKEEWERVNG